MSALYKTVSKMGQAPNLLKMSSPALNKMQSRNLNLLEHQSKSLLQEFGVTVQKFRVASNETEARAIAKEFPCSKCDNGFKGGVHLTKDPNDIANLCTFMIGN